MIFGMLLAAPTEGPDAAALADLLAATMRQSMWSGARDLATIAWQLLERSSFQEPSSCRDQEAQPPPASTPGVEGSAESPSHEGQAQGAGARNADPDGGGDLYIRADQQVSVSGQQGDSTPGGGVAEVHVEEGTEEGDAAPKQDALAYLVLLLERLLRPAAKTGGSGGSSTSGDMGVRRWRSAKLDFLADELSLPYRLASSRSAQLVSLPLLSLALFMSPAV